MTDRPIIFSAPMVRALLAGRKTQTRRAIKPQPEQNVHGLWVWPPYGAPLKPWLGLCQTSDDSLREFLAGKPARYAVGDRLWVREAWTAEGNPGPSYRADFAGDPTGWGWRSPIHMPRLASRLTLAVTDVRVQRLQEISEEDAMAEGAEDLVLGTARNKMRMGHRSGFIDLWDSIHGPEAWAADPWVVAVSFTVDRRNIDA